MRGDSLQPGFFRLIDNLKSLHKILYDGYLFLCLCSLDELCDYNLRNIYIRKGNYFINFFGENRGSASLKYAIQMEMSTRTRYLSRCLISSAVISNSSLPFIDFIFSIFFLFKYSFIAIFTADALLLDFVSFMRLSSLSFSIVTVARIASTFCALYMNNYRSFYCAGSM